MKANSINFNRSVYTLVFDRKGFPYVEVNTLADRVAESAEDFPGPDGVCNRLNVAEGKDGWNLVWYEAGGHARIVDTFATESEAQQEWLERTWQYDYMNGDLSSQDYDSLEEAQEAAAEIMELPVEVVKSIMHHHEQYAGGEAKRKAESLMAQYDRLKAQANGQVTKRMRQLAYDAAYPYYYMWGYIDCRKLDVEKYYRPGFKEEMKKVWLGK